MGLLRAAKGGDELTVRGAVSRQALTIAFAEARLASSGGDLGKSIHGHLSPPSGSERIVTAGHSGRSATTPAAGPRTARRSTARRPAVWLDQVYGNDGRPAAPVVPRVLRPALDDDVDRL